MSRSKGPDGGHRPTGMSEAQHVMFLHDPAKVQQNANALTGLAALLGQPRTPAVCLLPGSTCL